MLKEIGKYFIDTDLYYDTKNHFWLKQNGPFVRIGFTPLLQETSGSFVAIALENQAEIQKGAAFGSVEAEKHVAQLMSPIAGKIIAINDKVVENPRLMNTDPYGDGWLVEVECDDFESQAVDLLHGESAIVNWVNDEITKYQKKGWIAQS